MNHRDSDYNIFISKECCQNARKMSLKLFLSRRKFALFIVYSSIEVANLDQPILSAKKRAGYKSGLSVGHFSGNYRVVDLPEFFGFLYFFP